jgi:hypothetical protein
MTAGQDIAAAAHLLTDVLGGFTALPEYRPSRALQLVIARALGTIDLPPFASLPDLCTALARFAAGDVREAARELFHAWERARGVLAPHGPGAAALTIADIRRARRATGLTLEDLSLVADVPLVDLRDFEWGHMRNWSADADGRERVVRYARASGLDEAVVLSVAWPLIETAASSVDVVPVVAVAALVRSGPQQLVSVTPPLATSARPLRRRAIAGAAAAVLVGAVAAVSMPGTLPAAAAPPPPVRASIDAAPRPVPRVTETPIVTRRPTEQPAHPRVVRVAKRRPARRPNFLNRELFRIVFR